MVVDDHPALREGIAAMIGPETDMIVVGEAANGAEAVASFASLRPDVTLMDLQMPMMDGVDAIRAIRRQFPGARLMVLTTYDGHVQAAEALRAGACAYLLKSSLRRELLDTIRAVHAGKRYVPPDIAQQIALHVADDPLTPREIEIVRLVAAGNQNKQIARQLDLSEDTVKGHVSSILSKLDVNDRTQAVMTALRRGIITL
jgi:DNA-binding NarL/FixJ family response regulator